MPPCVNNSDQYTNIRDSDVYCGFIHIKGLHDDLLAVILDERKRGGPYLHLQDFIERTAAGLEQLNTLVSVGAFRFTGKSKKRLLWEANFLQKKSQAHLHNGPVLFEEKPVVFELPVLMDDPLDDLYDEMEILGFTLSNPFAMVNDDPGKYVAAKKLAEHIGKSVTVLAYFIASKGAVTKHNDSMFFGTFVDAELDWIDTVHFPDAARRYPLYESGFYRITGKVTDDFGVQTLEAHKLERVGFKPRSYDNL
jgi:DNA polymerase-3 subunit alpha